MGNQNQTEHKYTYRNLLTRYDLENCFGSGGYSSPFFLQHLQ